MEYWLISAPGEKTCQQTWESLQNVTAKQGDLSTNWKFHIPDLKVCIAIKACCLEISIISYYRKTIVKGLKNYFEIVPITNMLLILGTNIIWKPFLPPYSRCCPFVYKNRLDVSSQC